MNQQILNMLTDTGRNQDPERWTAIYHLLSSVCVYGVPGDVIEVGCNEGRTSAFMQVVMNYRNSAKSLHLFDSFQGMSDHTPEDTVNGAYFAAIAKGELRTQPEVVLARFRERCLRMPILHPGWVADTIPRQLPDQIAFALVDVDLYEPISHALKHIYPRLAEGAVVVVDDYGWAGTPGAKLALDKFLSDKPEKLQVLTQTASLQRSASAGFRKGEA